MLGQTKGPSYTMVQRAGTAVQAFEPGQGSGLIRRERMNRCAGLSRSRKGVVSVDVGVDVNQIVSAHLHSRVCSWWLCARQEIGRFSGSESTVGMV